jgi:1-acyl-sn-glycerol-3-phosphate acyltransferase
MDEYSGAGAAQRRLRAVSWPLTRLLWKIELHDFDRLPPDGPAILCPNHISFIDSVFLMNAVGRQISFVGKAEYMDSWKTKHLFPALGMIPIDRSGGDKSSAALDAAEAVLRRGELFGIFPEGTRSRNGKLHKGRTGAARLAMKVGCPIYPVGIVGTDAIQPPDAPVPRLFKPCSLTIGRPVKPERYQNRGPEHLAWRSMIDEVMYEIREITGQSYVDTYAGQEAETEPTVPARVGSVDEPVSPSADGVAGADGSGLQLIAAAAGD